MSATLVWIPSKKNQYKDLPCELRRVLQTRFSFPCTFGANELGYLNGLKDAGIVGAEALINIIEKHDEVELRLEY